MIYCFQKLPGETIGVLTVVAFGSGADHKLYHHIKFRDLSISILIHFLFYQFRLQLETVGVRNKITWKLWRRE